MSFNEWIRKNNAAATAVAVVLLAVAIGNLVYRYGGRQRVKADVFLYELNSGTLFPGALNELPPIPMPDGGQAVLAHVFSCGDCADVDSRFVGYLEKYTEPGKVEMGKEVPNMEIMTDAQVVSLPGDSRQWVPLAGPLGAEVRMAPTMKCRDAKECKP